MKEYKYQYSLWLILILISTASFAQEPNQPVSADTLLVPADTIALKPWEIVYDDSAMVETEPEVPKYNFYDSIAAYFLPERLNLKDMTIRSYGHDAGDFLRFNPSYFYVDYQPLPMRKIVSPFALPGNRIDVIFNNRALHPVEYIPEPDNMIDFEDLPTAPAHKIYNIEGPLGIAFGGDNTTSSLIMIPNNLQSARAESEMVVDKGPLSYANTKAVFSERKKSGRLLRLAVEYCQTDGIYIGWNDKTYHQWGDFHYPVSDRLRLIFSGRLYRRQGKLPIRPSISSISMEQDRRDRDLTAGIEFQYADFQKGMFEFRHQRTESRNIPTDNQTRKDLDIIENAIGFTHEAYMGQWGIRSHLIAAEEEFHDSGLHNKRHRIKLTSTLMRGDSSGSLLGNFGLEKVGGFNPAPTAMVAYSSAREKFYLSLSAGYSTKFPRQYELDLLPDIQRLVDNNVNDYFESGNNMLIPEKQLSGNLTLGFGRIHNDLTMSITGGKIFDGIDWLHWKKDSLGLTLDAFRTGNRDIEFADVTIIKRLSFGDWLHWLAGGSYRYLFASGNDNPPYSPNYQAVTNLELHHYIYKLDLHLYGDMEVTYVGPYESHPAFGHDAIPLGKKIVTNLKLSFRIKTFRFYYYWQNLFLAQYDARDNYGIVDQIVYYGLTWSFLD